MPRKAKEEIEEKPVKKSKKDTTKVDVKKPVNKVTTKTKASGTKMKKEKNTTSKKADTKITKSTTKRAVKDTINKKSNSKTSSAKSKSETSKKRTTKTSAKKVSKTTAKSKAKKAEPISVIEYYDLPYRYNQTIVKILAQTPKMLFVYWDIKDSDRKAYEEHYGNDFFSKTKPVLIVHNITMNYSFEIEINDFANSWYLHVNDADCKYEIELGRRPYVYTSTIKESYIHVTSSNEINIPNNHILFEKFNPYVTYKNIKTGLSSKKDFSKLSNYKNMQEIYNIFDLYKQIYKEDIFKEIYENSLLNPSSMSSSFMESSRS